VHFFLISQHSLFLVIEYVSEFWPVAWIQSDATVSPRFVCTYGGVSRGNFSFADGLKIKSFSNKQRKQFDSKFSWNLCRQMVVI